MKKRFMSLLLLLSVSAGTLFAAGDLETLCQKLPDNTLGFAATGGFEQFGEDWEQSIIGQIAADPQVQSFFQQLIKAISSFQELKVDLDGLPADYIELAKEVLRSPTIGAMALNTETPDSPMFYLITKPVTDRTRLQTLLETAIGGAMTSGSIRKRVESGHTLYVSNDPNQTETFYIVQIDDYLAAAVNDEKFSLLKQLSSGVPNTNISAVLGRVPSSQQALVYYVDYSRILSMAQNETAAADAQDFKKALEMLGLDGMRHLLAYGGFEGGNIVLQGELRCPASTGIWNAVGTADRSAFGYVDPKAMQAGAVSLNPAMLYDRILSTIEEVDPAAAKEFQAGIAKTEGMLDFKIREDLLENLEGTFMGYTLPAYSSPELMVGGYVVTARLKDAAKVQQCLLYLGNVIASMSQQQVQVTQQQTADGKPIHIWAVTFGAMMQIIPSWAIEGDTLIFTSHPNLTRRVMQQYMPGSHASMISNPEYAALLNSAPSDACMIVLTDSKAQARQLMQMVQRFWPMMTMGLMSEGIQLPIMLPSIDSHIEKMTPGVRYARKTPAGMDWYYRGTGLEGGVGGISGSAMGMAILMPALSKTKKIAQKVVCGTNLKGLSTAMMVYCNDYDDMLPVDHWCDLLIEEADVSPKSFVCPETDAIEGESSYAMNKHVAGKKLGELPPDTVLLFETDKGIEDGPQNASIKTRRHYAFLNESGNVYDEEAMVYQDCFNQLGGPDDMVLRHHQDGRTGCNIAFADGHVEFVTQDRMNDLRWTVD